MYIILNKSKLNNYKNLNNIKNHSQIIPKKLKLT